MSEPLRYEEWCRCGWHVIITGRDSLAIWSDRSAWQKQHKGCFAEADEAMVDPVEAEARPRRVTREEVERVMGGLG